MSQALATLPITVEQWANLDEDETGELVDGRLEEEEMPTAVHELVALLIAGLLSAWLSPRGGVAFGSELKLAVREGRGRKADASAYFPGRPFPARSVGATKRAPTVVVEVLSPRPRDVRRDTVDKLAEYAVFGVAYYWIVDPLARTLEVRRLDPGGRHVTLASAAEGAIQIPEHLGLVVDLDALWAETDKLPSDPEE
ncbi:MAG: Uma2 family endonuclease [Polyangiaceae bacterium]